MPNNAPDTIVLKKLPVGHIIRGSDLYLTSNGKLSSSSRVGLSVDNGGCYYAYYCMESDFPPQKKTWTLWKRSIHGRDETVYAWTEGMCSPPPKQLTEWSAVISVEAVNKPSLDDLKVCM